MNKSKYYFIIIAGREVKAENLILQCYHTMCTANETFNKSEVVCDMIKYKYIHRLIHPSMRNIEISIIFWLITL